VVALAVALILAAMGLPSFMRAYHSYQLTNAANEVADILRMTRYEAIRLNKQVNCIIQDAGGGLTNVWADSNGNNAIDPGEKTFVLQNTGNFTSSGIPGGLQTAAKTGTLTMIMPGTNVQFDSRGSVVPTGQQSVAYLTNLNEPGPGFRAVILMPAGSIEIWTSDGVGNWQQLR
jgi:Tfp pilus assembly protein FimT